MSRDEALALLKLLPQLLLADIEALEILVKNGDYEGAKKLAKKLKKANLFG
jgi:hypothetical protein